MKYYSINRCNNYILKSHKIFIWFITLIIFLLPLRIGSINLFNEPIFIGGVVISLFFIYKKKYSSVDIVELISIAVGILFSLLFVLILLINLPDNLIIKDLVEPFKPLMYSMFFITGYKLSSSLDKKSLYKYIIIFSLLSVLFSAFVFIPSLHPLVDLFKGRTSTLSFDRHFLRFSGTLAYPGTFGYWLVLSSLIVLLAYYKKYLRFQYFILCYASILIGIILTGSRGAIIIYFMTTPLFFLLTIQYKKTWVGIVCLLVLFVPSIIYLWFLFSEIQAISYLREGFAAIGESSLNHRLRELEIVSITLREGRLIGNGPSNFFIDSNYGPVESVYFFYGYKFGLFGLVFYAIIVLSNIALAIDQIIKRRLSFIFVFSIWSSVVLSIGAISTSITEEYKSFLMFFVLFGIVCGFKFSKKLVKTSILDPSELSDKTQLKL